MKIEKRKIDQEEFDRILAEADKNYDKIEFINCNISNLRLDNNIFPMSFVKCTVNELYLNGSNMRSLFIDNCIFCRLWIFRSDIKDVDIYSTHIGRMVVATATITKATIVNEVEIDACIFDHVKVYLLMGRSDYARQEDLPKALVEAVRKDSKPICPEEGSFIAYKKAYYNDYPVLITLLIPEDAERVSPVYSRKCRVSKANVLSIQTMDGKHLSCAHSQYDPLFEYKVGETVSSDKFDKDPIRKCSNGIHVFMTKEEAEEYNWA